MIPFPAQWHHLAVEDSLNSLSYPSCSPPARFSHRSRNASSLVSLASQTSLDGTHSVLLSPSSAFSLSPSPHASPSVFLPLPRFSLSLLVSPFVADSSAPEEHWGEQRKQRFGSVALILIFCRLDGRLGGAFIHTLHNHFPCNCKPWLQTTGVAAISTNVPSVTRRLYVSYLQPWLVGEHTVPNTDPKKPVRNARQEKEWNKGTTRLTQAWSKNSHVTRGKKKWINFPVTSLFCWA